MAIQLGQQLGNYKLIRLLGSGGFGEVYLGENIRISTQVAAIKVLQGNFNQQEKTNFENEARTVATLRHKRIVRLLDFGEDSNILYMIMEYAANGTLRDRHPQGTQVPLVTVVSYVKHIAEALQYAHDNKIIHRDIKPENIFVEHSNEILVGDFGIAVIAHNTQTLRKQVPVGTPGYAAPEQAFGFARPASDQYALGVMVCEWLSGMSPPFPQGIKIPGISPAAEQVVFKALEEEPKQRFSSMQEFAVALEQASTSQPVTVLASPLNSPVSPIAPTQPAIPLSPPPIGNWKNFPIGTLRFNSPYHTYWDTGTTPVWAPHQPYIAFVSVNENIQVWDLTTDNIIFNYQRLLNQRQSNQKQSGFFGWLGPRSEKQTPIPVTLVKVKLMTWAPHAPLIAITFDDGLIEVWNVITNTKMSAYYPKAIANSVTNVTWSPKGRYIVFTGFENVNYPKYTRGEYSVPATIEMQEIWEALTGKQVTSFQGNGVKVMWSPDEQKIACYYRKNISSHTDTASYDPWGSPTSAAVEWHERVVDIWDLVAKGRSFSFDHPNEVIDVAWLHDGIYIASTSKVGWNTTGVGQVRFWDTTTGESIPGSSGSDFYYEPLVWSSDKTCFAALDGDGKAIQLFDIATRRTVHRFGDNTYKVSHIEWSSDMEHILSLGGVFEAGFGDSNYLTRHEFRLWNIASGKPIFTYEGYDSRVILSPDGTRIATVNANKTLQIWDVHIRKLLVTFPGLAGQKALAWSPDSTLIATLTPDKLQIWQAV